MLYSPCPKGAYWGSSPTVDNLGLLVGTPGAKIWSLIKILTDLARDMGRSWKLGYFSCPKDDILGW